MTPARSYLVIALASLLLTPSPATQDKVEDMAPKTPANPDSAVLPKELSETLTLALRSNPELLEAEAQLRLAQARWNQARLKAIAEVTATSREIEKLQGIVRLHAQSVATAEVLVRDGRADQHSLRGAQQLHLESQASLSQAEARQRYLLGVGGASLSTAGDVPAAKLDTAAVAFLSLRRQPFTAAQVELLNRTLPEDPNDPERLDLGKLFERIVAKKLLLIPDRHSLEQAKRIDRSEKTSVDWLSALVKQKVTLKSFLEAFADLYGVCFVFRDYGVLMTIPEQAAGMLSPVIPEETPLRRP